MSPAFHFRKSIQLILLETYLFCNYLRTEGRDFLKCHLGVQVWTWATAKLTFSAATFPALCTIPSLIGQHQTLHSRLPLSSESSVAPRRCHQSSLLSFNSRTYARYIHGDACLKVLWTGQVFSSTESPVLFTGEDAGSQEASFQSMLRGQNSPLLTICDGLGAAVLQLELSLTSPGPLGQILPAACMDIISDAKMKWQVWLVRPLMSEPSDTWSLEATCLIEQ